MNLKSEILNLASHPESFEILPPGGFLMVVSFHQYGTSGLMMGRKAGLPLPAGSAASGRITDHK